MQTNFVNSRLGFDVAKELLMKIAIGNVSLQMAIQKANPTQGYLQSEIAIASNVAQYRVPILVNDTQNGNQFPTERRLALQDIFVPLELGIFVSVPASATAPTLKKYTYENLTVFSGGAAAALTALWAGRYSIVNDNIQVLPAWDLSRHYLVQRTQQAANTGYSASGVSLLDSFDGSNDGFYPVAPSFVLSGANNIEATITLPQAIGTVTANSRIVVVHRGILLQNVTSVK
jgi:hypothetical protein